MLRTWDTETGNPMIEFGDRLGKLLGVASVGWSYTGGQQTGTIVDPRFTQYPGCEPFYFVVSGGFSLRGGGAQISVSGNTLTWHYFYPEAVSFKRVDVTFAYGIY